MLWRRHIATAMNFFTSLLFLSLPLIASSFFLPGLSPVDYPPGSELLVLAHKLSAPSERVPHDYAAGALRECAQPQPTGLGQLLAGERARRTKYALRMLRDVSCASACRAIYTQSDAEILRRRIAKRYAARLSVDGMPVVVRGIGSKKYTLGVPLGTGNASRAVVYNHLDFIIRFHPAQSRDAVDGPVRVVGFEATPSSRSPGGCDAAAANSQLVLEGNVASVQVEYTYSVRYVRSNVRWVTRFDTLLRVSRARARTQWFAMLNAIMLAALLSASLAAVLFRTLRRDCARYGLDRAFERDDLDDDFEVDAGWRVLRGDVFRPPRAAGLLAVLCGSGAQLVMVACVTLIFALLGIASPQRRGSLLTALLLIYVLSSGFGGYVTARLHKAMGGTRWRQVTLGVALMLPGAAFATFLVMNSFMWAIGSIGAAPFLTTLLLLFLWLGVSVPLAFAGTYFGYKHKAYNFPVRTNTIPRPIPAQPWYLQSPGVYVMSGILPFGIVCIELRLILHALWQNEFYHMYAFLAAVFVLLLITCAEVSVVLTFLKLANSDYMWWWDSFRAPATAGAYVFAYSLYYLASSPGADAAGPITNMLFIAYSLLGSLAFSLLTGAVGFLSALAFTRRIYSVSVYD